MATTAFKIGTRSFGIGSPLVIAEIGTGHGGDPGKAAALVEAALEAGAGCVKFQHVYADEIIHPETGLVPLPGGPTPLYDTFKALETGFGFLGRLKELVESREGMFLCTPFGLRSARELRELGVAAMKIASPELNYVQLLDEVASYGLPTILSSGVSTLADIELALGIFHARGLNAALLHCVTSYPAPEADYNLRLLPALASVFGVPVGISDHSADPVLVPALAVAMGACVIEKHICLSRSDDGLDDPIALPPEDFKRMTDAIKRVAALVASGASGLAADRETSGREGALRELRREFGDARVEAVLGDGRKRLAPSERANYSRTNRSVHAVRPIARGERLEYGNLAVLRTEKVLRPGLEPRYLPRIVGRLAARDIPNGEGVEWNDLGGF